MIIEYLKTIIVIAIALVLGIVSPTGNNINDGENKALDMPVTVHFIDVGQGDCTLIELPDNETVLIDAGENDRGGRVVSYIRDHNIDDIDYMVATHPHSDHIGGLDTVMEEIAVDRIYMPKCDNDTKSYEDVIDIIEEKDIPLFEAKSGLNIYSEGEISLDFVAPIKSYYKETNDYSAVLKLSYGDISYIFMGDAEVEAENDILSTHADIEADVLRVGHHGSSSSTSSEFLNEVNPRVAVISVGEDNEYNLPSKSVIENLRKKTEKIFRTDIDGTVVIGTNGVELVY